MSYKKWLFGPLVVCVLTHSAFAGEHETGSNGAVKTEAHALADAIKNATPYLNVRYRYEYVDQDGIMDSAKASTIRTRFGIKTEEYRGFRGLIEAEDVSVIGGETYNSTTNGKTGFPVVADPEGTELNQAWVSYSGIPDTTAKYGRYHLTLDNVRFVGDVGWRQNNQTYDGATLTSSPIEDLTLFYGYSYNVNRIFGDDHPSGNFGSEIHMANVKYSGLPLGNLTAYAYFLDLEDAAALSSQSYGARVDGKHDLNEDWKLLYDAEFAYQEDHGDNPTEFDATYYRVEPGISFHGFTLKGGWEVLGSDDGAVGFSTPLATLHKWNGWADKFLTTPDAGLQDVYGSLSYTVKGVHEVVDGLKLMAVYHDFSADEGSSDFGTEWDFNLAKKLCDNFVFGVKYANYEADTFATDTEKLIFTLGGNFSL